jgi:hypothetical protein
VPIRWSALKVEDAAAMAEEFAAQLKGPAESIKAVAEEALKLPNIPEYIQQHFRSLMSEAADITGGVTPWNGQHYEGSFDKIFERIRRDIPEDALAAEKKEAAAGTVQNLL